MGRIGRDLVLLGTLPHVWGPTVRKAFPKLQKVLHALRHAETVPYIRHPDPWVSYWEDKSPKCLILKINRDKVPENFKEWIISS